MRFGIHLGNYNTGYDGDRIIGLALHAEQVGLDSVWVSDHVVTPTAITTQVPSGARGRSHDTEASVLCYESVVLLSVLAGVTSTVRLGTSVLVAAQRNPLVLAKQLGTLDVLAGGRLTLGVGGGWLAEEYVALGVPFAGRWDRLEECLLAFRRLWTEREAAFDGASVRFAPVRMEPKPAAPGGPPFTVGGRSRRALRLAGEVAWGLNASRLTPTEVRSSRSAVAEHAERVGRDTGPLRIELRCDLAYGTPEGDLAAEEPWRFGGLAQQVVDSVGRYAEHGVDELILSLPVEASETDHRLALDWLAAEVLPASRAGSG